MVESHEKEMREDGQGHTSPEEAEGHQRFGGWARGWVRTNVSPPTAGVPGL